MILVGPLGLGQVCCPELHATQNCSSSSFLSFNRQHENLRNSYASSQDDANLKQIDVKILCQTNFEQERILSLTWEPKEAYLMH